MGDQPVQPQSGWDYELQNIGPLSSSTGSSRIRQHTSTYQSPFVSSSGEPLPSSGTSITQAAYFSDPTAPVSGTTHNNKATGKAVKGKFSATNHYANISQEADSDTSGAPYIASANMAQQQLNINRYSFGFDRLNVYPSLVRWRFSDVVLCAVLFVLFLISWKLNVAPFQRQFYINDLTISHPFADHERVPVGALFFASFGVPTFVIGVLSTVFTPLRHKTYVLFVSLLGLYISLFTNCLVTEAFKVWIGRHRPDFLARCIVRGDAPLDTMLFAKDVCTNTNMAMLLDGFKTTPSGHSSISFAGLGYLSLWLSGQFLVSHIDTGAWRTIVSLTPAFGASYIAFSRTEDYRHHFVDVILGSLLGSLIAWWSYRRIFPSVTDEYCFLPYQLVEDEKVQNGNAEPYSLDTSGYRLASAQDDDNEL